MTQPISPRERDPPTPYYYGHFRSQRRRGSDFEVLFKHRNGIALEIASGMTNQQADALKSELQEVLYRHCGSTAQDSSTTQPSPSLDMGTSTT